LSAGLSDLPGYTLPIKGFDPLSLATVGSDETLAWFRASELKHSRVAMLATTGYIVQAAGFHFPGMLSSDVSFESLSGMKPFDAWDAVPDAGKAQILGTIFIAELATESQGTHYMKGGAMPTIVFPPIDFSGVSAETLKVKQSRELNNGRLAMIAIMSFIAANNVPGSVPALAGLDMF
jgi:Chlorophyll A-B binding protein